MTQRIRTKYAADLDPQQHNRQLADAVHAGITSGLKIVPGSAPDALTITAGTWWTDAGDQVEEDADRVNLLQPVTPNSTVQDRFDTIVGEYFYTNAPDKPAVYKILLGTPGSGAAPRPNNDQFPLAYARLAAGASTYSDIFQAPRVWRFNAWVENGEERNRYGSMKTVRISYVPQDLPFLGLIAGVHIDFIPENTLADGAVISPASWRHSFILTEDGELNIQTQLAAIVAELTAARGNTTSLDSRLDVSLHEDGTLRTLHADSVDMPDNAVFHVVNPVDGLTVLRIGGGQGASTPSTTTVLETLRVRYESNQGQPRLRLERGTAEYGEWLVLPSDNPRGYVLWLHQDERVNWIHVWINPQQLAAAVTGQTPSGPTPSSPNGGFTGKRGGLKPSTSGGKFGISGGSGGDTGGGPGGGPGVLIVTILVYRYGGACGDHDGRYLTLLDVPPEFGSALNQYYPSRAEAGEIVLRHEDSVKIRFYGLHGDGVLQGLAHASIVLQSGNAGSGTTTSKRVSLTPGAVSVGGQFYELPQPEFTISPSLTGSVFVYVNSTGELQTSASGFPTANPPFAGVVPLAAYRFVDGLLETCREVRVMVSDAHHRNTVRLATEKANVPTARNFGGGSIVWVGRLAVSKLIAIPVAAGAAAGGVATVQWQATGGAMPLTQGARVTIAGTAPGGTTIRRATTIHAVQAGGTTGQYSLTLDLQGLAQGNVSTGWVYEARAIDKNIDWRKRLVSVTGTARRLLSDTNSLLPDGTWAHKNYAGFRPGPAGSGASAFNCGTTYFSQGYSEADPSWESLLVPGYGAMLCVYEAGMTEANQGWRLYADAQDGSLQLVHTGLAPDPGTGIDDYYVYLMLTIHYGPQLEID